MKCPYNIKVCTKCNRILIVCEINFYKNKKRKDGFSCYCRECTKNKSNNYYKKHREERLEYAVQYREEHKEEIKEYKENNKEKLSEYNKIYQKQYCKEHKEEKKEYDKIYREEHKEEKKEYDKIYREEHKEEIKGYQKQYYEENKYKYFNYRNKRRSKLENQGRGITKEQWYEMMNFFNWCCAYSGEYIGGEDNKNIRSIDHIIALDNEGLNEPWNCVPMLKSYNCQKHTKDMEEWYKQQSYFSEERLIKIYQWIEYAYNKWKF